jgi:selenocysteine-specific elongation factor
VTDATAPSAAENVRITLGTAGHIDHGKTLLVRMLTGCETDRLKEEKERGMSIELGFAPCLVAGQQIGIVDVPGHEHFIKTMVAGATGMDGVILVVAADDGIMPQTREHLDILTLLGMRHGIVALTKTDRVPPERRDEVCADLARYLAGTFLDGAPVLPISSITGEGYDDLLKALQALVRSITPRSPEGVFRLAVERVFSVKGYGTVLTGIPVAGQVRVGDDVVLLPQGLDGRVTGLQVYGQGAETAAAGQCAAVNVRHWDARTIERGHTLTLPGYFEPHEWYAVALRLLPLETLALKNAARVKFHTGTSEVAATVYLMAGERVRAGEDALVQLRLERPVVAGPGDPFILRTLSPPMTVGGGHVVEDIPRRLRRNQPAVIDDLAARAGTVRSAAAFVEYVLRTAAEVGVAEADLGRRVKQPPARLRALVGALEHDGRALRLGGRVAHRDRVAAAEDDILRRAGEHHEAVPESPGLAPEDLLAATGLAKDVLDALLARMTQAGRVAMRSGRVAIAGHEETFVDKDREAVERVERLFLDLGFSPRRLPRRAACRCGRPSGSSACCWSTSAWLR